LRSSSISMYHQWRGGINHRGKRKLLTKNKSMAHVNGVIA